MFEKYRYHSGVGANKKAASKEAAFSWMENWNGDDSSRFRSSSLGCRYYCLYRAIKDARTSEKPAD